MTTTTIARAWSITRKDGLTLGFTDHDQQLSFHGISFRPDVGLTAQAVVQGTGLSVDNTEVIGALSDGAIEERDIVAGRWDGAELCQWEVDWADPSKAVLVFRGHLGEVTRGGGMFRAELRGLSEPLNKVKGRVFQPRCSALLADSACKVDMTAPGLSAEGILEDVDGARLTLSHLAGYDDRWFERGRINILTGEAAAIEGHIKNDRAMPGGLREIDLWVEPGGLPRRGDRIRIEAGCNKSASMCRAKFNNFINFRGFPHLPEEDWLMAPAKRSARSSDLLDNLDEHYDVK
ncbi:DUF2163 domain-containing protein [Paracoccus aurantiacus]|uniref:DUF2163 domain-containing protein n=1 Tax=Paracoccus aurantiacus TaxID=2599412 RepID=A0A5C6S932_9RHOB|nr:DUF2163 domain-containing protein [Paracoccus aurantiacus]TXB70900.1 DUF2163 domain-containing protein [Paracoccus aurantiacus]